MPVSSRTPERFPCRCRLCGAATIIEFSLLAADARCPNCGHLLWQSSQMLIAFRRRFVAPVRPLRRPAVTTTLPQLKNVTVVEAPQFGLRLLLSLLTTCAAAFAILAAQAHDYLNISAVMVIVFWIGACLSFVGLALDSLGDFWLAIAAVAESMGLAFVVIALFTGIFYAAMFALTLLRIIA